jgi:hypothetical protein
MVEKILCGVSYFLTNRGKLEIVKSTLPSMLFSSCAHWMSMFAASYQVSKAMYVEDLDMADKKPTLMK